MDQEARRIDAVGKRTRARKPKVKTGCTTCKVRRVKCDEGKPACERCLSTGRACDGYSATILICEPQKAAGLNSQAGRASSKTRGRGSEPLVLRNLTVDIDGTGTELRFFHTFRVAVETEMELHVSSVSCLWRHVAPRLCHHDEAVKHALVALGATYHLHKSIECKKSGPECVNQQDAEKTRLFVLVQYNASVGKLQRQIASGSPQSITASLVCCLAFICLENLRGNYRGGVAHLRNGARIIETTLDLGYLCVPAAPQRLPPAEGRGRRNLPLVTSTELKGLVEYFRHAEICESLFSHDVPLVLASRLYIYSHFDDGTATLPSEFTCLAEAYEARVKLVSDVMALDWETRAQRGDAALWASPESALKHQCLSSRAALVIRKYLEFLAGERAPRPGTYEHASSCLDMLLIKSMQAVMAMMPVQSRERGELLRTPFFAHTIIGEMIHFAELLYETTSATANGFGSARAFTTEAGIVAPTYFAYVHATVADYRARALRILEGVNVHEGPWAARYVAKLVKAACVQPAVGDGSSGGFPSVRGNWADDFDCHTLFSEMKIRDDMGKTRSHAKQFGRKTGKELERRRKGWVSGMGGSCSD